MSGAAGLTRYLVAPDKFKGSLSAAGAAEVIAGGILRADPTARIVTLPFADGGEGTVDAVIHAGGSVRRHEVRGPLGDLVDAEWAVLRGVAFIEMSGASGLKWVTPTPETAVRADTRGTGELIGRALDEGLRHIVVGVGGSATTDGGFGALGALGVHFLDGAGERIVDVARLADAQTLDLTERRPELRTATVVVCADVLSPLAGEDGAALVFARQKGADAAAIGALERRLRTVEDVYGRTPHGQEAVRVGGAAGGLAAGMIVGLEATIRSGVEVLADVLSLDDLLRDADLVIVGEGSLDDQSRLGKTPVGIARRAQALGVPALAVVGVSSLDPDALRGEGILEIHAAVDHAPSSSASIEHAARYVEAATVHAITGWHRGRRPGTIRGGAGDA